MNARLPLAFVVLRAEKPLAWGRFVVQPRCSELDTTEIEASLGSRASPEVVRGRPRGADRWRAAWPAFPATAARGPQAILQNNRGDSLLSLATLLCWHPPQLHTKMPGPPGDSVLGVV
ncbi:hypothetical protein A6R68_07190, partial [Neotoma lepida]